ncbi:MAG: putative MAPEG superfamily protein [Gammaproteobacteria bacterium]|jgi:uncharacterized MAPEG superfamily protein
MDVQINEYGSAILAFGVIGGLLLLQLLVADVLGIVRGHTPGSSIENDHKSILFRAARAHANTNETIAAFIVLLLFSIVLSADPKWINSLSIAYLIGRVGHMCCYYADQRKARSVFFGISFVALLGLFLVGWGKWLVT